MFVHAYVRTCVCACMSKLASLRVLAGLSTCVLASLRVSKRMSESPSLKRTNPVDPSLLSSEQFFDNPHLVQFLYIPFQVF